MCILLMFAAITSESNLGETEQPVWSCAEGKILAATPTRTGGLFPVCRGTAETRQQL